MATAAPLPNQNGQETKGSRVFLVIFAAALIITFLLALMPQTEWRGAALAFARLISQMAVAGILIGMSVRRLLQLPPGRGRFQWSFILVVGILAAFALTLTCCTVFSQTAGMDSEVTYGFPLAPGLKRVGGGHVRGGDGQGRTEITWNAYATDRPVGEVVAFYQSKLGNQGMEGDAHGATWSFPAGAKQPERVLEVAASTKNGPWREGDKALLAKSKCVVMLSQASRVRSR